MFIIALCLRTALDCLQWFDNVGYVTISAMVCKKSCSSSFQRFFVWDLLGDLLNPWFPWKIRL